jgi:hypothetical protein
MRIRFHSDADAELAEAREWYARQRSDLDAEFMQCIDEALMRIARDPTFIRSCIGVSDAPSFAGFLSRSSMNSQLMRLRSSLSFIPAAILKSGNHGCYSAQECLTPKMRKKADFSTI